MFSDKHVFYIPKTEKSFALILIIHCSSCNRQNIIF